MCARSCTYHVVCPLYIPVMFLIGATPLAPAPSLDIAPQPQFLPKQYTIANTSCLTTIIVRCPLQSSRIRGLRACLG